MDVAAKLTSKGQITVPKAVRDSLSWSPVIRCCSVWKTDGRFSPARRIS